MISVVVCHVDQGKLYCSDSRDKPIEKAHCVVLFEVIVYVLEDTASHF